MQPPRATPLREPPAPRAPKAQKTPQKKAPKKKTAHVLIESLSCRTKGQE